MTRTILVALLAGIPAGALANPAGPRPFCTIVAPAGAPALVQQAATELRAYLERLTNRPVPVSGQALRDIPAVVLRVDAAARALGDEGYSLQPAPARPGSAPSLTIRGRTPLGVLHGAYRLLREYGIGFYFDGDAVPTQPPARFLLPSVQAKPVFAIRGSLPWYNFFDSPTTWDDHDFRFFADQIVRSGQNFVGFHTYDNEPFAAYEDGGRIVGGEPLLTTADRVWGTYPLPVDEFGFGTGRFFLGRFWGSDAARQPGTREERIARQKALLARGLAYASARGIKTCLGFEVSGDPTDPAEQRRFRARLQQLVTDYPMLDYVWLWQPEAMSLEGTEPPALRSQGAMLYREWEPAFAYIRKPARKWEGMRVAAYARLARQLLDAIAPDVRLVLSGWGGDHHLHVSDYFPAWDRVLDKRIIFAALDDIVVGPTVSQYYRLPADRERWAIPWYEYDGDQWFPQANAHVFAETVRDARRKGCQGLLAIHWRMKEVGESQALVARYAWEPQQTLAGFYRDYGIRRFGRRHGAAIGKVLQELDAMGYRWLGGPGQAECAPFSWCYVPDAERGRKLRAARARLAALRQRLRQDDPPAEALGRLDDVIATIDRGLLFNRVARLMVAGGPVDKALAMDPADPERAETCRRLLRELTGPTFGDMLHRWAQTITTRGELGVLATINAKAYYDLRVKVGRLREACGEAPDAADLTRPSPRHRGIVSDFQHTGAPAGLPLTVRCVAFSGEHPARRVTLFYTTSAQPVSSSAAAHAASDRWTAVPMHRVERCVFEATLPPRALPAQGGWVRYRIVAQLPDGSLEWPAVRGAAYRQVHVFPPQALVSRHNQVRPAPGELAGDQRLRARVTDAGAVRLSWEPSAPLAPALLERRTPGGDWARLGTTLDREWEDASAPHGSRVEYRLLSGAGRPLSECTVVTPPPAPPAKPTGLAARARGTAVRLTWDGGDLRVSHFSVERAPSPDGPFTPITPEAGVPPRGFAPCTYVDRPRRDGTVFYRVRAHGFGTAPPAVSDVVTARALARVPEPRLDLDFEGETVTAPTGPVAFSGPHRLERVDGRGVLRTDGGLLVPYGAALAVKPPFTVAVRFRQAETTPMPVLVCQGAWMGPGYFVQLLNGQLRFYVGGAGCLDRRVDVQPGRWHTAVCVHDGAALSSYFDGVFLGEQPVEGEMRPSDLPFTVARYCQVGPEWTFKGDVDFVRLYDAALEPWMVLRGPNGGAAGVDLDWRSTDVALAGQKATWHQTPRVLSDQEGAADLSGGLTIPFCDLLPLGDSLVLETRFLARNLGGMPVLISQGVWPGEGYLLQILGRRIRFHLGGIGSLDCGPELEVNRWYSVRCAYDGSAMRVWLDGQPVGERAAPGPMLPSLRPLRIGRYEIDGPEYVFHGLIGQTRIHAGPLETENP